MNKALTTTIRWTARLAGLALAAFFLFMASAEILHPHSGPPRFFREWTGIALLALACLAPLAAWKWELEAALLSLSALAAFVAIVGFHSVGVASVIALPAALFLADWALRKTLLRN